MPFFRSLSETAPGYPDDVPWPISGLPYVIAFMGPFCGGIVAGATTGTWLGALVGLLVGATTTLLNAWLSDTFIDRWLAKFHVPLNRTLPRVCINIVGFSWAIGLCAFSMFTTWAILT
jgi:uncharacterized membrane protein